MTTRSQIERWFNRGVKEGATHMLVVCDTWDYEDYPVYVKPGEDPREIVQRKATGNMQRLMECYALHKPFPPGSARVHDYSSKDD